jgi:membrane protein DedA with SNARE-associated domain
VIAAGKALLVVGVHLRLHHQFHGPAIDYAAVIVASFASWVGVPGPGEPVLIAAAVIAARHNIDITGVIVVAWLAATAGGIAGWAVGRSAGRAVVTAPGPLHSFRRRAVERGDEVFQRVPIVAILLTPSWVAGINRARPRLYLPVNAFSALLWAAGIGYGAYLIGPAVVDVVDDVGLVMTVGIVALVVLAVLLGLRQRRRRAAAREDDRAPRRDDDRAPRREDDRAMRHDGDHPSAGGIDPGRAPAQASRAESATRRRSGTGRPGRRRSAG